MLEKSTSSAIINSKTHDPKDYAFLLSENSLMDYVTLKGIKNRTGVDKDGLILFILKELIDNALDIVETKRNTSNKNVATLVPSVSVSLTRENNCVTIKVSNPETITSTFTEQIIKTIFCFDKFYSSKRHQYRITRGSLGDAQEIACVSYVLAEYYALNRWNRPLIIKSAKQIFDIYIDTDRISQTITSRVEVQKLNVHDNTKNTEIQLCVPFQKNTGLASIKSLLVKYAVLNTHISFHYRIKSSDTVDKLENNWEMDLKKVAHQTILLMMLPELGCLNTLCNNWYP